MKKIKFLGLGSLMLVGTLFMSNTADARKISYAYTWPNGCVGIHNYHSALWGAFTWETYEVVDCPPGVEAPDVN